jgi:hypothetical protein
VRQVAQRERAPVLNKPFTLASIRGAMAAVLRPVEPLTEGARPGLREAPSRL